MPKAWSAREACRRTATGKSGWEEHQGIAIHIIATSHGGLLTTTAANILLTPALEMVGL